MMANTPGPGWSRRRVLTTLASSAAALPLAGVAGCAGGGSAAGSTLRIGVEAGPSNMNPLDSGSEVTRWIAEPIMESLYDYDDELRSVPLLASAEPKISDDGLTMTIPLKKGITFHNGDEFTAEDVVASLKHVTALASGSEWIVYFLHYYSGARAVDRHTVEIKLNRRYGLMRSHLTNLPITHRSFVGRKDTMMGTGPYRLDRVSAGLSYALSAYPDYHGTKAPFQRMEYQIIPDGSTRAVNLRAGKVDIATNLPVAALPLLRGDQRTTVHKVDAPIDILTYVKAGDRPFSDGNFRKAIACSMDRQAVVDKVFGGAATIGQGPVGPAELGYDPALKAFPARPDPGKAEHFLAAAGGSREFTLTIAAGQTIEGIAQILVENWKKIGVTVKLDVLQSGPWAQRWISGDYQMIMNKFASGFTSGAANYLTLSPAQSGSVLACGYRDTAVDKALDRVWETSDHDERARLLKGVNRTLAEDAVMFPPAYPKMVIGQRDTVAPMYPARMRISRLGVAHLRPAGGSGA
ncbi:ABC transporter substrate-binding protein [Actinomadura sp. BRA 177]|uniref:ABC transporter substrate-binding protein n=1 Tax=Actinomadura sp. BRA 177 TaxID=2745202 RepID=UPI001595B14F|nr:ABC transporter substrate-binding protein [Actinomadura sp. BRA 177]